ncbi:hypothetical protein [Bacillus sp. J33]|nr:hypothetical protein [Bacillus sp. J33]
MKEITEKRFCEICRKDTAHIAREDALEIEYICKECNHEENVIKSFF